MKAFAALSGLVALAAASPTKTVQELPKRADGLPAVTVSGNGSSGLVIDYPFFGHSG